MLLLSRSQQGGWRSGSGSTVPMILISVSPSSLAGHLFLLDVFSRRASWALAELLVPQRHHRLHAGRAGSGNPGCQQRCEAQ
jgi:hypothetical protein